MTYRYSVYTTDKRVVRGTIDAASERMAEEALYRAGYHLVLRLKEAGPGLNISQVLPSFFGVKTQHVIEFSRQLAALLETGIPILTALQLLEEQAPTTALRKVISSLARELQEGSSLSQALARHPRVFSDTYCQVIKASEAAGKLGQALKRIAGYLEKETAAQKKLGQALIYPAIVLIMAFGVFILLTTIALPPLVRLFTSLGGELPWATRTLLVMGVFFINFKFHLLWAIIVLIILIYSYTRLPAGKLALDKLILKIPVISNITIQRNMYRFCQIASMLLKAGLPLPQIINMAARTVGNVIVRQVLGQIRGKLVQGQGLSQSMASISIFPRLLVEMVVVGETTGNLDTTLSTMADYYEERVDQRVQALISMIEPALIVIVGVVVAFMAISMISPIYSILRTIR